VKGIQEIINEIRNVGECGLFGQDFLLTWEKSMPALTQLLSSAEGLKWLYDRDISAKLFSSGLAVSQFRDNSTRTRFSYAKAANLLGLTVQDLDEGKSQISHGETVRETANMISFMSNVIGIRDDMFLGAGHTYMQEVADALDEGFKEGVLHQRPAIVNLQCDIDHPTQTMADLLHLKTHFGSLEALKGKKIAMTWAYSPSYGKPLSVPQGIIGLLSRFGMDVVLAHPEGYDLIPDVVERSAKQAAATGGSFLQTASMDEAFREADIVYPKSWAPFSVMQQRTDLLRKGDRVGLDSLEKGCLEQNSLHKDWECDRQKMDLTRDGKALYMHCLPADISGVSCEAGEVSDEVFEEYRIRTYKEAGYKPFIIAAMMLTSLFPEPGVILENLFKQNTPRILR